MDAKSGVESHFSSSQLGFQAYNTKTISTSY